MISRYSSSRSGISSSPAGSRSREQSTGFGQSLDQDVDVPLIVVDADGGPGGGRYPELAHEWFGTVVTRPHAHRELVEDLGQVVCVHVPEGQRQDPAAVGPGRGAEHPAVGTEALAER